jgi:hypothetical protein
MNRGGPLPRYTPLVSSTPLPRSTIGRNQGPKLPAKRPRSTGPAPSVLRILARRSEGLCEFWQCLNDAHHTHHRLPRRMGGRSNPDINLAANLVRLCPGCHDRTESRRTEALEIGMLLRAGAAPLRSPVLLRYGRVLLGNDGTWTDLSNSTAEEAS